LRKPKKTPGAIPGFFIGREQKSERKNLLFVNKKKQKNFFNLGWCMKHRQRPTPIRHCERSEAIQPSPMPEAPSAPHATTRETEVFLVLFSKKNRFLPLHPGPK
jgi:hypothetical protein